MVNGEPGHRRTQASRSAATRGALLDAAAELFAAKGFAAAGREEIVARAGVTRGAMYHHFADKTDLFRAVFEATEHRVMEAVATAAMAGPTPLDQLRLGCRAYLDTALDAAVSRICIVDAPAVLPADVRQAIATDSALGMIVEVVEAAVAAGQIAPQPVDALAHLLLATVMAASQYVAMADDQPQARADAGVAVDNLLDGLAR